MACDEELNQILLRVGEDLDTGDVKKLLFLLEDIPMSEKERISTGTDLMFILRKRDLVGSNHLERLKPLLAKIGRKDLKLLLEKHEHKVRNINAARTDAILTGVPNFVETEQCKEVEAHLQNNRLVILRGISGSGKTQLSLWCAKRFRSNTESYVWKLSCQDINDVIQSLRTILEFFQMKFESQNVDKCMYVLEMISVIKQRVASEEWQRHSFLFIFDNICKVCASVVSEIFHALRETSNVKILASTESSTFYQQFKTGKGEIFVAVKGVSKKEVWNFFQTSDHFIGREDDLDILAKNVGYLPYALMLARSYMESTVMTVNEYLEKLKSSNFLQSVENLVDSSERYNKGLVGAQVLTLEKIEKQVSEFGKHLLQCMAFLDYENVPLTLLKDLASAFLSKSDVDLDIRNLIFEMKLYSIGDITRTGEGNETVISLHAVTKLVILHRLNKEERIKIIKTLLGFFSCHLSMDCRLRSSLATNLLLQSHAKCVLVEAEKEENIGDPNEKDQLLLLKCIIQTAIGVSFRVSGTEHVLADEYLTKARKQMFLLINESSEAFKLSLDEQESSTDQSDNTASTDYIVRWTEFLLNRLLSFLGTDEKDENETSNASKIKRLYTNLVYATKDLPPQFFTDFVLKMNRSEMDIQHLKTVAGMETSDSGDMSEHSLTPPLYEKLKSVKAAMHVEQIRDIFAVELMIIILYNNGRHYYQWKLGDKTSQEFCCNELLTAALLGKLLKKNFPDFLSVQYLISHRNGMFYHYETDKRFKQGRELAIAKDDLEKTICRLENMSDKKSKYFEFGILKVSEFHRVHQEGMSLNLILKCLIHLCKEGKEEDPEQHYSRAEVRAEQLHTITKEMQAWTAVPGFHIQLARFYMIKQTPELLQEAVNHFQIADNLETQYNVKGLSHFQLQARFGLVKCYKLLGGHDSLAKAQGICQCLITRLDDTNLSDIRGKAQRHLEEVQNLMDSSLDSLQNETCKKCV